MSFNDYPYLQESDLITSPAELSTLKLWLNMNNPETSLLYKATRDGFKAQDFHRICDERGPTISLIQSDQGNVFGAFTKVSFRSTDELESEGDPSAFIFSLTHLTKHDQYNNKDRAVCHQSKCLMMFGKLNPDFAIQDKCN